MCESAESWIVRPAYITELYTMMTIYDYAKFSEGEKEELLKNQALFVDQYNDNEVLIQIYFLNGFFVEVTIKDGKVTDNIPYQRGYKITKDILKTDQKYCLAA
jgi:hypothetical protein